MSTETDSQLYETLLPTYYKRFFPFKLIHKWLSYGEVSKTYFSHREFSFTLKDDVYFRYQSFSSCDELKDEIVNKNPVKIDIGAVYTSRPKDHKTALGFQPSEKELVFDIDMTDYDDVRFCCRGADICEKCWSLMIFAVKILERALREDFGFRHILWVYSGRRGIHCWVCDEKVRKLTKEVRQAIVEYLSVVSGGDNQKRKVLLYTPIHASITKALSIVKENFDKLIVEGQDFLDSQDKVDKMISIFQDQKICNDLRNILKTKTTSSQRWDAILNVVQCANSKNTKFKRLWNIEEIMLQYCYPRLDVNVSIGVNHLLKSPFCVHPKTGRVCVPFLASEIDSFDPFSVPTLSQLIEEINQYDSKTEVKLSDYKKTSLKQSVEIFKKFLSQLESEWHEKRLEESDQKMEF